MRPPTSLFARTRVSVPPSTFLRAPPSRYALHTSSPASSSSSSSTVPEKVPVSLIASLRKTRPVPMSLARQALSENGHDIQKALAWLDTHSPAEKAAKLSSRTTGEGTIAISVLGGKRVSMVHLACETDFVGRNEVFLSTARGIAGTAAFLDVPTGPEADIHVHPNITSSASFDATDSIAGAGAGTDPILEFPVQKLMSAPLIATSTVDPSSSATASVSGGGGGADGTTVSQALLSSLSSTGENLRLLRAISYAAPFPSSPIIRYVPGAYAHGGSSGTEGKVGGVVVMSVTSRDLEKPMASLIHGPGGDKLEEGLNRLARDVARQVVGFPTQAISSPPPGAGEGMAEEEVLLEQQFMMIGEGRKVREVLESWGEEQGVQLAIVGMRRWSVGDDVSQAGEKKA